MLGRILAAAMLLTVAGVEARLAGQVRDLHAGSVVELPVGPAQSQDLRILLQAGESVEIEVLQIGTDAIIDVLTPEGRRVDSFDGPTGRNGIEKVSFFAKSSGHHTLRIRLFDGQEPEGRFRLTVKLVRTASETGKLLTERARSRRQAATWLRPLTSSLTNSHALLRLAAKVKVIGLGEATHGSREFNDTRLALTKELVERGGFRVIAIEWGASRASELEPYANGRLMDLARLKSQLDVGWIGPRIRRQLYAWVRSWNLAHPDDGVTIVGVDAGDNEPARTMLFAFLRQAYSAPVAWASAQQEIKEADAQGSVFGDSSVSAASRTALIEIQARLEADRPMLEKKFGKEQTARALAAAAILFEFADYNAGRSATTQSRDWYMAMRVLRSLKGGKTVYWAHNAHVATTKSAFKTTGRLLREALGDKYCAIGATCGAGSFIAQVPNDPADRLATSSFSTPSGEVIEDVLSLVRPGAFLSLWRGVRPPPADRYLVDSQPMHWIGGLFTPGSPPATQFQPFRLTRDFDGIVYLPKVSAEDIPASRPLIPARKR